LTRRSLLDLNVLIALTDPSHKQHQKARSWFLSSGKAGWGICPLTEAGFVRVTTNPGYLRQRTLAQATAVLQALESYPGYNYWKIDESWATLTAPFAARIFGHQQVTDAYLLGMAIKVNGTLVTFDKGVVFLAGAEFRKHVHLLA
jgi:toxin-antitoxin system PIN domain toxin